MEIASILSLSYSLTLFFWMDHLLPCWRNLAYDNTLKFILFHKCRFGSRVYILEGIIWCLLVFHVELNHNANCEKKRTNLSIFLVKALRYIRQIAQETSGEVVYGLGRQPAVLRTFSQRLTRWLYNNITIFSFCFPFLSDFSITLFIFKFD